MCECFCVIYVPYLDLYFFQLEICSNSTRNEEKENKKQFQPSSHSLSLFLFLFLFHIFKSNLIEISENFKMLINLSQTDNKVHNDIF